MPRFIEQTSYTPENVPLRESLFMVGNGHFGIRGSDEERRHARFRGTLINGFFEKSQIHYGEWAFGYAQHHETILNAFDAASIELTVNDKPLNFSSGLTQYRRRLNFDSGTLTREIQWSCPATPSSSEVSVEVKSLRMASFVRPTIALVRYEVRPNAKCEIRIDSLLDASIRNRPAKEGDPRVGTHIGPNPIVWETLLADEGNLRIAGTTRNSNLGIAAVVKHRVTLTRGASNAVELRPGFIPPSEFRSESIAHDEELMYRIGASCGEGDILLIEKFIAVVNGPGAKLQQLLNQAEEDALAALKDGADTLLAAQSEYLRTFWAGADIRIEGDAKMEEALRFNMFHLLESAGQDGATSLAAKGLSGEGYEGHYFWDTEIYALPFFIHTMPKIARTLVQFRINLLDKARQRAQELSLPGALFPWRTIDGEETSAYFPAGTAQFHIDADIAYGLLQYAYACGDVDIFLEGGAELLFETARLWMGLGFFNDRKEGKFCIPCVTGPDEYTALVDNNAYTNFMAQLNLQEAHRAALELKKSHPQEFQALAAKIGLNTAEVESWRKAADAMYIPSDKETGIIPQDDQWMDRPAMDLQHIPRERFPLLLHYHPLMIYRHRVLKQPDTVLAMILRHDSFSLAEKMRNFRYYEPLTTGDSSLSHCIQSVMAAESGEIEKAYAYFVKTARMDLDNLHGNSQDGVHIAAMAGSWISVVYGFAGMRSTKERISFTPHLPAAWKQLAFTILWRGSRIAAEFRHSITKYTLIEGNHVELEHEGKLYHLTRQTPIEIDERPRPRAWIFDLDGVITNTAVLHTRAWEQLAIELDLPFPPDTGDRVRGISRMAALKIVLGAHASEYDEKKLNELAERKNRIYKELIGQLSAQDILPGISDLLDSLRADGIPLVLASASQNAPEILERLGLRDRFYALVNPLEVRMPKPDPEIFLRAAELAECRIQDCIALEDAQAGIDAIRGAGMFSVGIGPSLKGCDIRFNDTSMLSREAIEAAFVSRVRTS